MRKYFLIPFICLSHIATVYAETPEKSLSLENVPSFEFQDTTGDSGLTWENVDSLVLAANLELTAAKLEVDGSRAGVLQAGTHPNPAVSAQFENFAGTWPYQGARSLETTVSLNQSIETGGKRKLRRQVAMQDLKLAEFEFRSRHTELLLEARSLYWDVLLAQETLHLEAEDLRTAKAFLQTQELRRRAGKSPLLEEQRARTALLNTELNMRRLERESGALRVRLALLMGRDTTLQFRLRGSLGDLYPLPASDSIQLALESNLEKGRSALVVQLRQSECALEKANAVSNFEMELGWRHSSDISAQAVVAGLRMPVPIWDRNRGSILRAQTKISQAQVDMQIAQRKSKAMSMEQYQRLVSLRSDILFIRDSLLVSATASFKSAYEGFQLGKYSPLEVLDARRSFLEARQSYLDTLSEYHHLRLEMDKTMRLGFSEGIRSKQEIGK